MKATTLAVLGLAQASTLAAVTGLASAIPIGSVGGPTTESTGAMSHDIVGSPASSAAHDPKSISGPGHTRTARKMADLSASPFVSTWMRGSNQEQVQLAATSATADPSSNSTESSESAPHSSDDDPLAAKFRIVGGFVVKTDVPFFAELAMITDVQQDGSFWLTMCGGTLIDPTHVLTAAHCFFDENTGSPIEPGMLQMTSEDGENSLVPNILVQLGGNLNQFVADPNAPSPERRSPRSCDSAAADARQQEIAFEMRRAISVDCHPGYSPDGVFNDICIIRLDRPSAAPPVRLNFVTARRSRAQVARSEAAGELTIAYGYGATSTGGDASYKLRETFLPLVGLGQCRKQWAEFLRGPQVSTYYPSLVEETLPATGVICASTENGRDTCSGDSGGPLINRVTGVQVGIVSYGYECATGVPAVYTQVSAYQGWVLSTLARHAGYVRPYPF